MDVAKGEMTLREQRDAMRDGKVLGWECSQCHRRSIIPIARCTCGGKAKVIEFKPEGSVVTYTIQNVASEQFLNEVPFAWAIIELDGGPRVSGWVPFVAKPEDLPPDQRVRYTPSYKPGMMFEKA